MSVKLRCWIALFFILQVGTILAQSYPNARSASKGDDLQQAIRQLRTHFSDLKHELRNHEIEIRTFEEKLHNQEISFDQQRQQFLNETQSQKDVVRAANINFEGKIDTLDQSLKNLESLFKGVTADLRQMKSQANDSVIVLGQYKQKIGELEKSLDTQNQHLQNLEAALQSLTEVLQAKETAKEMAMKGHEGLKSYKVQSGDTLEKIAKAQKVSVQSLRDVNQLIHDRIIIGQTLKIP